MQQREQYKWAKKINESVNKLSTTQIARFSNVIFFQQWGEKKSLVESDDIGEISVLFTSGTL